MPLEWHFGHKPTKSVGAARCTYSSEGADTRAGILQGEKEIAICSEVPLLILFTHPPSPYLTYSIYPEGVFNFPQGETLPLRGTPAAEQAAWRSSMLNHGYQELDIPWKGDL